MKEGMHLKHKYIAAILGILLSANTLLLPVTARDYSAQENLASDLKSLGLFKGVSETDFALNREPTRVEALVMLIRVLGKENDALNGYYYHPFTDVPAWADSYVGYAYQTGLTKGVSETEFGSGNAGASTYLTFVLRALGYSDTNGLDFTWDNPYDLAENLGILTEYVDTTEFMRADVATVSYAALAVPLKNSPLTLAQTLIEADVFSNDQFDFCYNYNWQYNFENLYEENDFSYDVYDSYDMLESPSWEQPVSDNSSYEDSFVYDEYVYDYDDSAYDGSENVYTDSSLSTERISHLIGNAVFWAPTGNKIHLDPSCSSFKAGITYAGTLQEAQSVRTEGWCGICSKYATATTTSSSYATAEILVNCYTYEDYLNQIP